MVFRTLISSLLSFLGGLTSATSPPQPPPKEKDWPFDVTELQAPDGSITAKFVSIGATLTELWVKDKDGTPRDVVLGYDDPQLMVAFVGHTGQVTLHGGIVGWDRRNWTIESKSRTSVTYKHVDEGHENWPGTVTVYATHTVENGGVLKTVVKATATEETPIMVTQHIYWNLDAFQDPGVDTVLDTHHLQVDASRVIEVDGNAIPTGKFIDVQGTPLDFRNARRIGERWDETMGLCGEGCQGYDSAWIYDRDESERVGTSLWSDKSGIRVDISTDQPAVQIYSSYWMNTVRKTHHGGAEKKYGRWSAMAIEQEGYIAAVNTPEWSVDQIYSPERPFEWNSTYKFSTVC
ncbi:hypothetical protein MD484_g7817, partial [Candolleomyces efflorescens]